MAILCTTDGSERSLRALPHAARVASVTGEELTLLRVLEPKGPPAAQCEQELNAHLAASGSGGRVLIGSRGGGESVADVICRVAGEIGARLIAFDTRGSGALRRAVIGSVAVEVLEESPAPLLMTGPNATAPTDGGSSYRVAFAADGAPEHHGRLAKLVDVMDLPGIEPILIGVSVPVINEPENPLEELTSELRRLAASMEHSRPIEVIASRAKGFEKVEAGIVRLATEAGAEAIGMVSAHTSRTRHIFMGSVSLATLNRSHVPIILARADA